MAKRKPERLAAELSGGVVVPVDMNELLQLLEEEGGLEGAVLLADRVVLLVVVVALLARANRAAKRAAKAQIISCDFAIFPDFSLRLLTQAATGRDENVIPY